MKVLIVGGIYSKTAKFNNVVFNITNALSSDENVLILTTSRFPFSRLKIPKCSFKVIEPTLSVKLMLNSIKNIKKSFKQISEYMNIFSIYGIVCFFRFLFNVTQMELVLKTFQPDIIHIHSTDLERSAYFHVVFNNNIPMVATIHGLYSLDPNITSPYNCKKLEYNLLTKMIENRNHITFVSTGIKNASIDAFQIPSLNLHVITNGVDTEQFKPITRERRNEIRRKYKIPIDDIVLIQVGTIYKLKNHISVLRAIVEMDALLRKKIRYVIVGEGEEKNNLIDFCREKEILEYCNFTGAKFGEELLELYGIADFLILPSTTEAFPLVCLEAVSMGLPIITFKDLWLVEDLYNVEYMELIPSRSTKAIIQAIETSINRDWNYSRIRSNAKNYSWENIVYQYKELYRIQIKESNNN